MQKKKKNKPPHYIDNKKFTEEVTIYAREARDALESGDLPPPMNDYIGQSILDIATKMANRANFIGYTFKSDMVGDSLEDVVKYLKNFDPAKLPPGKKPSAFSYVSRIIWFAFLRRMGKEQKQHDLKQNLIYSAGIIEEIANLQEHDDTIYENQYLANIQSMADDYYKMMPQETDEVEEHKKPSKVREIPIPSDPKD